MSFTYIYPPPLGYPLTYLGETFPEHHAPLEHTRQKVGHAVHDFFVGHGPGSHTPRADVRETMRRYYIDIELPGLNTTEGLNLKWFNRRTLIISTKIERPELKDEEPHEPTAPSTEESEDTKEQPKPENPVHILKSERQTGQFFRMFEFSADVDHDSMELKLQYGLLRIMLAKKPHEQVQHKQITVEHDGS
jgi:HSP20 family molecular chaperone IbpA